MITLLFSKSTFGQLSYSKLLDRFNFASLKKTDRFHLEISAAPSDAPLCFAVLSAGPAFQHPAVFDSCAIMLLTWPVLPLGLLTNNRGSPI